MSKSLSRLFTTNKPYEPSKNDIYFLRAMKETVQSLRLENPYYRKLCESRKFSEKDLRSVADLSKIPVIPTLFFKRENISTQKKSLVQVTSSGTSGKVSQVSFSLSSLLLLARMSITLGFVHGLFSMIPTRYIMLGYQPTRKNKTVISKTAFLSTLYALGVKRTYALRYVEGEYVLDLDNLIRRLQKYSKGRLPVRVIGFPSYTYFLLQKMKQENIICPLPKGSKVLFGGGWKQFSGEEVTKETLYDLVKEVLDVNKENIHEFFGAAEHPVLYCTCKNHHYHVPVYAKVLIRDVATLEPVSKGEVGLLNLLTPIPSSLPLVSVLTDDLAVLHPGEECGCGIQTDYVEILGRVGVKDIKTCSSGAKEYLKGQEA